MKRFICVMIVMAIAIVKTFAIEYTIKEIKDFKSYISLVVEYESVSADMTGKQMVSGVITIPINGKATVLMLDNHHTISSNDEAPSVSGTSAVGKYLSGAYCIAATDYIGYGSTKDQVHPYLCAKQNAQNSIDLAKVAWQIIEDRGVELEHRCMINVGYSQGGAVAMAVHREMENNPELAKELHFGGSWCGDGPYDVKATLEEYLNSPDDVAYPLGLPLLVNGFLSGAPAELKGDLKFSSFITQKMLDAGLEEWIASKMYSNDQINAMIRDVVGGGTVSLADIFNPEMTTLDGTLAKKYLEFVEMDNLCKGWTPTYPIKLVHLVGDEVVPVVNAYHAIDALQLNDNQYAFEDVSYYNHATFGMYFYLNLVWELSKFDFETPVVDTQAEQIIIRPVKRYDGRSILIERNGKIYDISGRGYRKISK